MGAAPSRRGPEERSGSDVIATNGKSFRRSFEGAFDRSPQHAVNGFAACARVTFGQFRVDGRSDESMAMPALLVRLGVGDCTTPADAMRRRRATEEAVAAKGWSS